MPQDAHRAGELGEIAFGDVRSVDRGPVRVQRRVVQPAAELQRDVAEGQLLVDEAGHALLGGWRSESFFTGRGIVAVERPETEGALEMARRPVVQEKLALPGSVLEAGRDIAAGFYLVVPVITKCALDLDACDE